MNKRDLGLYIIVVLALLCAALPVAAASPAAPALAAGPAGASTLGNYVWLDANANGEHIGDANEEEFTQVLDGDGKVIAGGIDGVTVNVYHDVNKNGVVDPDELASKLTMQTGDDPGADGQQHGWYKFTDLTAAGNQYIVEVDPSNFAVGGPLEGLILTSQSVYGPNPMAVTSSKAIEDWEKVDFGFIQTPLKIEKALLDQSPLFAVGNEVHFKITVTNTSSTLTLDPVPLDDFYAPSCLTFKPDELPTGEGDLDPIVDAVTGHLHWDDIGALDPGDSVEVLVTFIAANTTEAMAYKDGGWKDYAPKGIPDFDERQAGWDNPVGSGTGWYQSGPVAMANSLWWFDSKFEDGILPPPNISDSYPLVQSYNAGVWDDHDQRNVPYFVSDLSTQFGTTATAGTTPDQMYSGVTAYILSKGLDASYVVTEKGQPAYSWTADEIRRSEDVTLLLGFWQHEETGALVRIGGHWVTASGISGSDPANGLVAISDPIRNNAEDGGPGRVFPGAHIDSHPVSVGTSGDPLHNDTQYISQDAWSPVALVQPFSSIGEWGLPGYIDSTDLPGACTELAVFEGKNVPSEYTNQGGPCSPNNGTIITVVEYAVAVSPKANTLMCTPTTNIAAVTGASPVDNPDLVLPPVQDERKITEGEDFGDLADTAITQLPNGARALVMSPLRLGVLIDTEADGQIAGPADGDDNDALDDEDGVSESMGFTWKPGALSDGKGGSLQIIITGGRGVPQVFMDFGGGLTEVTLMQDSAGSTPYDTTPWPAGTYTVYFDIPSGTAPGANVPTRVRLSSQGGLTALEQAPDGEVEDYLFNVPTSVAVESVAAERVNNSLAVFAGLIGLLALAVAGWRLSVKRARV